MQTRLWRRTLAILASFSLISVGCGSHSPTSPDEPNTPTVSAPEAPAPTPPPVAPNAQPSPGASEAGKAVIEVLEFSAADGRVKLKNNGAKAHPVGLAIYQKGNPDTIENQTLLEEVNYNLHPGQVKVLQVSRFPERCWQLDPYVDLTKAPEPPTFKGENLLDVSRFGGYYYGSCQPTPNPTPTPTPNPPTCATVNPQLTKQKTGETDTSVTYQVNANVPGTFTSAGTPANGTGTQYTVTFAKTNAPQNQTVSFVSNELNCPASTIIEIPPKESVCATVGTTVATMTKVEGETTATVTSTLTYTTGFSGYFSLAPDPVSGFSSGNVASGDPKNSVYNRPNVGQNPLTVTMSWTVKKEDQVCAQGTKTITITPKPPEATCADYTPPTITGNPDVATSATQVTVTAGTVAPTGGTFNPTLPIVVQRPDYNQPAGSWSMTYSLSYGPAPLNCKVTKSFSGPVPPKDPPVRTCEDVKASVQCSTTGANASCDVDWINPGNGSIRLNSGSFEAIANGATKTYNNLANGAYTVTLKVEDGSLTCQDTDTFVIEVAPSCPPSQTTLAVDWTKLYESTYGNNPKCRDFGLISLFKKEFNSGVTTWATDRAASMVIVKDGICTAEGPTYFAKKATPTDPTKWVAAGLEVSFLCGNVHKDLSHVEMCGCPE